MFTIGQIKIISLFVSDTIYGIYKYCINIE